MELQTVFTDLGIALGLGLLVGLQRESVESPLAGVRTFPLATVLGTLCAMLAVPLGGWFVAAGFLIVGLLVVAGNIVTSLHTADVGLTTEIALILMFAVGCYVVVGPTEVAVVMGGGVAVLLQAKKRLQGIIEKLGEEDVRAIMQFALISLVILPVLPDAAFGPFDVLNLREIWLMVVLIVGLSLGGYIIFRFWGEKAGTVLGGILGGVISSTATTFSYARRSARAEGQVRAAAIVIMIASTVVIVRVAAEVIVVAPEAAWIMAVPLGILFAAHLAACFGLWISGRGEDSSMPPQDNPTELKPALLFAALYAVILVAVAAARVYFGNRGLYLVAGMSGLTDVDALTLSAAQLTRDGRLAVDQAWRMIVIATVSNLVFKTAVVGAVGGRGLLVRVAPPFGFAALCGVLLVAFYPVVG